MHDVDDYDITEKKARSSYLCHKAVLHKQQRPVMEKLSNIFAFDNIPNDI